MERGDIMSNRFVVFLLTAGMMVTTGCGASSSGLASSASEAETKKPETSSAETAAIESSKSSSAAASQAAEVTLASGSLDPSGITADEDTLKSVAEAQEEDLVKRLTDQSNLLISSIDTYDAYKENADQVENLYDTIVLETKKTAILYRQDSAVYASALIESGEDPEDIYDDLDDITDDIYDGVLDDLNDDIYDGLMDDLQEAFYDGALEDSDAAEDYSDWSDTASHEYKNWSRCASDVYQAYSDAGSDIYRFVSNLEGDVYQEDLDEARDDIEDFNEDIARLIRKIGGAGPTDETTGSGTGCGK